MMAELTGKWYLRERFLGGYDIYVEVTKFDYPIKYYRKIKRGEEIELYNLNNKNK